MRTRLFFFLAIGMIVSNSVGAEQPTADQIPRTEAARQAWEKAAKAAADAVVDDGFMNSAELEQKRADAYAGAYPVRRAAWNAARGALENGDWSVDAPRLKLTLRAWDRRPETVGADG